LKWAKPNLKERMSIRQYTSYEDMYDTTVKVERVMKEKNEFYNEQWGIRGIEINKRNHHS